MAKVHVENKSLSYFTGDCLCYTIKQENLINLLCWEYEKLAEELQAMQHLKNINEAMWHAAEDELDKLRKSDAIQIWKR